MGKAKKPRRGKYDEKLSIDGTFLDVIKVSVKPLPKLEPMPEASKKKAAKKK